MNAQDKAKVQQALEALEVVWREHQAIDGLRHLLEQPEQEHDHALEQALTRLQKRYNELEAKVVTQPAQVQGPYSAPIKNLWNAAPKPWVGLTDAEAKQEFEKHNCVISADLAGLLARAIEAKLREKNGGA